MASKGKSPLEGIGDFFVQSSHDIDKIKDPIAKASTKSLKGNKMWKKGGALEEPKVKAEREATKEAAKEKIAARGRIKPMPDPESGRAEQRKAASRRRQRRGGRAATVLSGERETLG